VKNDPEDIQPDIPKTKDCLVHPLVTLEPLPLFDRPRECQPDLSSWKTERMTRKIQRGPNFERNEHSLLLSHLLANRISIFDWNDTDGGWQVEMTRPEISERSRELKPIPE
jgi:hypothetical protein